MNGMRTSMSVSPPGSRRMSLASRSKERVQSSAASVRAFHDPLLHDHPQVVPPVSEWPEYAALLRRESVPSVLEGWSTLAKVVHKLDLQKIQGHKEDLDNLLVFVSRRSSLSGPLRLLRYLTGGTLFGGDDRVLDRIVQGSSPEPQRLGGSLPRKYRLTVQCVFSEREFRQFHSASTISISSAFLRFYEHYPSQCIVVCKSHDYPFNCVVRTLGQTVVAGVPR